jgi:hypothetical protein
MYRTCQYNVSTTCNDIAMLPFQLPLLNATLPLLVSLTTVSFRLHMVHRSILSVLQGKLPPTHVFLFVSREAHLLDEGITRIPSILLELVDRRLLTIVFTENTGPHRKLLPLLRRYYNEDVLIANVDDDMIWRANATLLYELHRGYEASHGLATVALRSRRIGVCSSSSIAHLTAKSNDHENVTEETAVYHFMKYANWSLFTNPGRKELLLLPTGTGGVLYRPQFFDPVVFDARLRMLTETGDDLMFRLACLLRDVPVFVGRRETDSYIAAAAAAAAAIGPGPVTSPSPGAVYTSAEARPKDNETELLTTKSSPGSTSSVVPVLRHRPYAASPARESTTVQISIHQQYGHLHHYHKHAHPPATLHGTDNFTPRRNLRISLYKLNKHSKNDEQWADAVRYLQQLGKLNVTNILQQAFGERGPDCHRDDYYNRACSLSQCNK